jgi:hypothetical protein
MHPLAKPIKNKATIMVQKNLIGLLSDIQKSVAFRVD